MPPAEDAFAASDEDSDGSDGEAVGMIEHLPRSILRSTAEIHSKKDSLQVAQILMLLKRKCVTGSSRIQIF